MSRERPDPGSRAEAPLVSVVTPFLDPPPSFFREAIESVLRQTLDAFELLLVDDGSAAEVVGIAAEYARRDPLRVRLLRDDELARRGLSAARNRGIQEARGDYVAFLDADDVWLPIKLEEQTALLREHSDAGMLYGNTLYWYSWSGREGDRARDFVPSLGVEPYEPLAPPGPLPLYLRGRAAVPCTCSIIVRREIARAVGGFEPSFTGLYEDQVFYAKACLEAPVLAADACWDRYRQHADSLAARASAGDEREARARFLDWVERHARERGGLDPCLRAALRSERRALRHPLLARGARLARKLARRAGLGRPGRGTAPSRPDARGEGGEGEA